MSGGSDEGYPEIHHHMLDRRSIENYLPRRALERWARLSDGRQEDLRLAKTVTPPAGTTPSWTLTVTNDGPLPATNVVVTDVLPARLNIGAIPTGCTYDAGTRTLRCTVATLANGESASAKASETRRLRSYWAHRASIRLASLTAGPITVKSRRSALPTLP